MSSPTNSTLSSRPWIWLLALILLLRLASLATIPLTDHTEARYAEIARLMVQTGDWISPHVTPSEVFWAKPPLSTWGQALTMTVFGVSEWAARLPAVGWAVLTLWALAWLLRGSLSRLQILVALLLLALSPLFFISAGAAMTDATLAACVMAVQAAWWRVVQSEGRARLQAGRFLGLAMALALLTKGPAAALLALLPVFMHAAWRHHGAPMKAVLRDPWVWLLCLGVSLPWYIAAELKTPGFISYFVLGEHVMRFLQPGWTGDRYGFAHAQPLGIIWPYTALAGLPSVLVLLIGLLAMRLRGGAGAGMARFKGAGSDLAIYALCIALAPLLIFSFARNLIWTYAMTALPGLAILASCALPEQAWRNRWAIWAVAVLMAVYTWAFFFKLPTLGAQHSEKPLIAAFERACGGQNCKLSYIAKPPYSAYFYTAGRLYDGMPGALGAPGFNIAPRPKNTAVPADALACNKEQCLRTDTHP